MQWSLTMFKADINFSRVFLESIEKHIPSNGFDLVESGLKMYRELDPACILEAFLKPLTNKRFPEGRADGDIFAVAAAMENFLASGVPEQNAEIVRYEWWIHEGIGLDTCSKVDGWVKIYISSLFNYCERLCPFLDVGGDYYHLIVDAEVRNCSLDRVNLFLMFIEWLDACVEVSPEYENYYALLSWLLLRRLIGGTSEQQFNLVMNNLRSRQYTKEEINSLPYGEKGCNAWFELHQRIPLRYGATNEDFEAIILGVE